MKQTLITVVTGLSGAGKTTALRAFEDLDYFCVDNLPPSLLPKFVELCDQPHAEVRRICVGMDIRQRQFLEEMIPVLEDLRRKGYPVHILFLEASDEILIRRFRETRRQHPLGHDRPPSEVIAAERDYLEPIREASDRQLDTSSFTGAELRDWVRDTYSEGGDERDMVISLMSFGYKGGVPSEADLVFDVRFLPNPYFVESLKEKDGREESVYRYVIEQDATEAFLGHLAGLLEFLLPSYAAEGKAYLAIAFGCTGGQHRSVSLVRWAEQWLLERGHAIRVIHRDLPAT